MTGGTELWRAKLDMDPLKYNLSMNHMGVTLTLSYFAFVAGLLVSCQKPDYPESIFNKEHEGEPVPVVQSINPADSTWAGVGEITIAGENFSPEKQNNLVFFSGTRAEIISCSDTLIIVKTPLTTGDSLEVRVSKIGADLFSEPVYYKLLPAVVSHGSILSSEDAYGIAVDLDENVYVSIEDLVKGKTYYKAIKPDGSSSEYAGAGLKSTGMKIGPGNELYAAWVAPRVKKIVIIDSTVENGYRDFVSLGKNPYDLDFDESGNIWVAAETDLIRIKPDLTKETVGTYPVSLTTVRVYDNNVYVAGKDTALAIEKIWRSPILPDGSLGDTVAFLDITSQAWLEGASVYSFTFSTTGEVYLGTDHPTSAIFTYNPFDGSYAQFYPGLISATVFALSWGETYFLYAVQQTANDMVLKIDVQKDGVRQYGAPYYGRQ